MDTTAPTGEDRRRGNSLKGDKGANLQYARGFCDLNISATDTDLRQTVLKALSLGYQTVAINRDVTDASVPGGGGKKKHKENGGFPVVPPPPHVAFTQEELWRHGITRQPVILTRLTVTYGNTNSPFLVKHSKAICMYDLLAITPTTEKALKQAVMQSSPVEVDIIALNLEERSTRYARRLLKMAKEKNMHFELSYSPCLTEGTSRQQTIALAHSLHQVLRSTNVVITSRARLPRQLRQPYDVINLGRFFGLTEAGSKAAVASTAHNLVYCAAMRRVGVAKCAAQVTVLPDAAVAVGGPAPGKKQRKKAKKRQCAEAKFEGLEDPRKYLKTDPTTETKTDPTTETKTDPTTETT